MTMTDTPIEDTGYSSEEEAHDALRAAYDEIPEVEAPKVFECKAYNFDEFQKRVDRANRRLEKAGAADRFEFSFETFEKEVLQKPHQIGGAMVHTGVFEPWFRATLTSDWRIAAGNYTFVASLVAEEAGYTVHTAPGQSLDGWTRPAVDDIHCDHCGTIRNRKNLYIIRNNTTGELTQIGTNCLAPVLGFSPQSLWSLTWTEALSDLAGEVDEDEESWGGYRGAAERTTSIDGVLAISWVVTSGGMTYVSTKASDAYSEASNYEATKPSTVSKIRAHLAGRPKPYRGDDSMGVAWDAIQAKVEAVPAETIAAVKASVDTVKSGTDYGDNLRTILAAESGRVTFRNVGILGSLVAVYAREQDRAEERAAKAEANPVASGFIGQPGERIRNFSITVRTIREFERDSFFGYGTETATMVIGATEDNHIVKWVYAGTLSYEVGDVIKFEAATVKKQDNWKGTDQTILTRGKIDDFEERARECQAEIDQSGETYEVLDTSYTLDEYNRPQYNYVEVTREDGVVYRKQATKQAPVAERWFNSKKELKRFAEWQAAQKKEG